MAFSSVGRTPTANAASVGESIVELLAMPYLEARMLLVEIGNRSCCCFVTSTLPAAAADDDDDDDDEGDNGDNSDDDTRDNIAGENAWFLGVKKTRIARTAAAKVKVLDVLAISPSLFARTRLLLFSFWERFTRGTIQRGEVKGET